MSLKPDTHARLKSAYGMAYADAAAMTAALFGEFHPDVDSVYTDLLFPKGPIDPGPGPGPRPEPGPNPGPTPGPGPEPAPTLPCPEPTLSEYSALGEDCENERQKKYDDAVKECERKNPGKSCIFVCSSAGMDVKVERDRDGICHPSAECNNVCEGGPVTATPRAQDTRGSG